MVVTRRRSRLQASAATFAFAVLATTTTTNTHHLRCDAFLTAAVTSLRLRPNNLASSTTSTTARFASRSTELRPTTQPYGRGQSSSRVGSSASVTRGASASGTTTVMTAKDGQQTLDVENVVIIGSGPAGYTAAIYAGRANLKPLCFEGLSVGPPGGQLMTTTDVDNFPGFPEGVTGPQLMNSMREQGERWGAVFETEDVEGVDFSTRPFVVRSTSRTVKAQTVIIATGATARRLGLPSEPDFWSQGISACAICDGAAPIYRGEELGVVGGGDSAVEEAVYLTKYSPKVHLFVRGTTLKASKAMIDRLAEETSVEVHLGTVVEDAFGKTGAGGDEGSPMMGVLVRDEGGEREIPIRGLFYAIGHSPNTKLFQGHIKTDPQGYVEVKAGTPQTSVAGVFAAGDVQDKEWRQAVTAAGTGCTAALAAERFLAAKGVLREVHQAAQKSRPKPKQKKEAEKVEVEDSKSFDIEETRHRGPYAYQRLYFETHRPLVVKYISPTCGPCKALGRLLDRVVDEMADEIHFVEVDIAASPDIAQKAGITGTPTVQIFRDQALLETVRGVKGKNEYRQRLRAILERPVEAD